MRNRRNHLQGGRNMKVLFDSGHKPFGPKVIKKALTHSLTATTGLSVR